MNEAALFAGARRPRDGRRTRDLQEARDKVLMGVERRSVVLSELDRVNCAYHEAGHAVVAALLPDADPLHKVTIIPRGRAMGVTMQLPEADRHTYTKGYLETQIAVLMGGRVAEELFMNHMTSGASNDIERATDIAQHMVCEWGMSALGLRAFRKPGNAFDADQPHAVSEATAQPRRRGDPQDRAARLRSRARIIWIATASAVKHAGGGAARAGIARGRRNQSPALSGQHRRLTHDRACPHEPRRGRVSACRLWVARRPMMDDRVSVDRFPPQFWIVFDAAFY